MQREWSEEVERVDCLVEALIGAATLAGAYRALMTNVPETRAGFTKLADRHSARVAALAEEIGLRAQAVHAAALSSARRTNAPKC